MTPHFLVLLACAMIPFVVAIFWFHSKTFGGDFWNKIAEIPEGKTKIAVKPIKLALSVLLNFLVVFGVYNLAIHESGVFGMVGGDVAAMQSGTAKAFLLEHGGKFHSLTHGLAHGIQATLLFAIPFLGYTTIFEKKTAKYFWVYLGFWLVSLTLISIVVCLYGASSVNL